VAVHAEGHWPAIIVSCGTATAFTVLDDQGRLCGGAIAPGPQVQMDSLFTATAQLPATTLSAPRRALARSTEEAIRAGVMFGYRGGVNEILRHLMAELPGRAPSLVFTGGNAPYLSGSIDCQHTLRPLLVLEGLRMIGARLFRPS
jgi:type III pantothenate kinase